MSRNWKLNAAAGVLALAGFLACGDPGPAGPGGEGDQTTVTDRTNLDNGLPGCENVAGHCRRVRICVKSGGCNDYAPHEVVDCPVGAQWPKCKK